MSAARWPADAVTDLDDVASRDSVSDVADVVIVGTGAGGATVARVLTEAGIDVLLVEEGPWVPSRELRAEVWAGMKRVWRKMGSQVAEGRAFIPLIQGRCVGGSTAINGAIMHRLPEAIHAAWSREHGLGDALPYARLERIWDRLDAELGVAPAPEAVLGNNNRLMRRAAERLGIAHNAIRRNVVGCEGSARCLQGCATDRRQSMNVSYVPRALAAGARLYARCLVERVTSHGGRASGIEGRFVDPLTGRRGPRVAIRARHAVVVAASALQTPLLLAASGVGRASRQVGRRLQMHPATAVVGMFDEPVDIWSGVTQGYETKNWLAEGMKMETVALPPELGAVRLPGLGPELMRQLASYGRIAQWGVEVRAEATGTARRGLFGRTTYRYDPTPRDVALVKLGVKRLCEMMFAAGARTVLPGVYGLPDETGSMDDVRRIDDLPDDPRLFHLISSHHFGTAVMGPNASTSVVGPDGESHELPGLFVADGSIFPTAIGVNPQHTIAALAWTIAERVANEVAPVHRRLRARRDARAARLAAAG